MVKKINFQTDNLEGNLKDSTDVVPRNVSIINLAHPIII